MEETSVRKHEKDWFQEIRCGKLMQVREGVRRIAEVVGCIWPPPLTGD